MRAEQILPGRVPIPCWRCGQDTSAVFDLIRIPGRNVAVCRGGCPPTVVSASPYGVVIPPPPEESQ